MNDEKDFTLTFDHWALLVLIIHIVFLLMPTNVLTVTRI